MSLRRRNLRKEWARQKEEEFLTRHIPEAEETEEEKDIEQDTNDKPLDVTTKNIPISPHFKTT